MQRAILGFVLLVFLLDSTVCLKCLNCRDQFKKGVRDKEIKAPHCDGKLESVDCSHEDGYCRVLYVISTQPGVEEFIFSRNCFNRAIDREDFGGSDSYREECYPHGFSYNGVTYNITQCGCKKDECNGESFFKTVVHPFSEKSEPGKSGESGKSGEAEKSGSSTNAANTTGFIAAAILIVFTMNYLEFKKLI